MTELLATDSPSAKELLSYARTSLEEAGYKANLGEEWLVIPFSGELMSYSVDIYVGVGYITVLAELPLVVGEDQVGKAMAVLNEKSVELPLGSFQIHPQYRKVQFKIGIVAYELPPKSMIGHAITLAANRIQGITRTALKWVAEA